MMPCLAWLSLVHTLLQLLSVHMYMCTSPENLCPLFHLLTGAVH